MQGRGTGCEGRVWSEMRPLWLRRSWKSLTVVSTAQSWGRLPVTFQGAACLPLSSPPSHPQAGPRSLTCSSIQGSPLSASPSSPFPPCHPWQKRTCSRVSCNEQPTPSISMPVRSSQPIFLLPFTAERVVRTVCSPCLLFLTGYSVPTARDVHTQPQLGAGGQWSKASA